MRDIKSLGRPVLAIAPSVRGFGYALFEKPDRLIDWGVKQHGRNKNHQCLLTVAILVQLYHPSVLIIEDYAGPGSRRAPRIQALIEMIRSLAKTKRIRIRKYSRAVIRETFSGSERLTRLTIAQVIAEQFAELEPYLPPKRKIWKSEDHRMAIFDAMSLALTHFAKERRKS